MNVAVTDAVQSLVILGSRKLAKSEPFSLRSALFWQKKPSASLFPLSVHRNDTTSRCLISLLAQQIAPRSHGLPGEGGVCVKDAPAPLARPHQPLPGPRRYKRKQTHLARHTASLARFTRTESTRRRPVAQRSDSSDSCTASDASSNPFCGRWHARALRGIVGTRRQRCRHRERRRRRSASGLHGGPSASHVSHRKALQRTHLCERDDRKRQVCAEIRHGQVGSLGGLRGGERGLQHAAFAQNQSGGAGRGAEHHHHHQLPRHLHHQGGSGVPMHVFLHGGGPGGDEPLRRERPSHHGPHRHGQDAGVHVHGAPRVRQRTPRQFRHRGRDVVPRVEVRERHVLHARALLLRRRRQRKRQEAPHRRTRLHHRRDHRARPQLQPRRQPRLHGSECVQVRRQSHHLLPMRRFHLHDFGRHVPRQNAPQVQRRQLGSVCGSETRPSCRPPPPFAAHRPQRLRRRGHCRWLRLHNGFVGGQDRRVRPGRRQDGRRRLGGPARTGVVAGARGGGHGGRVSQPGQRAGTPRAADGGGGSHLYLHRLPRRASSRQTLTHHTAFCVPDCEPRISASPNLSSPSKSACNCQKMIITIKTQQ